MSWEKEVQRGERTEDRGKRIENEVVNLEMVAVIRDVQKYPT